jgi:lysozyme family protein
MVKYIQKSIGKTTNLPIDISKQREQYTSINWYYITVIYQERSSLEAIYYSKTQAK